MHQRMANPFPIPPVPPIILIFMRHGQAINNTKRLLAGRTPGVSLTPKGVEQAKRIAKFLKPFNISAIYSSPIERAEKTAAIVAKHNSLEYKIDERLIELDMGKFTVMELRLLFKLKTEFYQLLIMY